MSKCLSVNGVCMKCPYVMLINPSMSFVANLTFDSMSSFDVDFTQNKIKQNSAV